MISPILKPRQFKFSGEDYEFLLDLMKKSNQAVDFENIPKPYKHTIEFKVVLHGAWVQDATMNGVADIVYDCITFHDTIIKCDD